jgi:hypothetical protein
MTSGAKMRSLFGPVTQTSVNLRELVKIPIAERSSKRTGCSTGRAFSSLGSESGSADLEETSSALIAPAWLTAGFRPATQLFIADHRKTRQDCFRYHVISGSSSLT